MDPRGKGNLRAKPEEIIFDMVCLKGSGSEIRKKKERAV